ncbi:MAG: hypothetical protein LBC61_06700 [Candidatus Peribacteria bacterium]|jgi:hypothetical protein|nr:hypothetical protein [Candidatus Peribacteria bacterium]
MSLSLEFSSKQTMFHFRLNFSCIGQIKKGEILKDYMEKCRKAKEKATEVNQ